MERVKFTSISKLAITYDQIKSKAQFIGLDQNEKPIFDESKKLPVIKYKGTVKLHGTCSGVTMNENGEIHYLSKERVITPQSDNDGFAAWCNNKNDSVWKNIFNNIKSELNDIQYPITLFGEWCGKGVQKKAAITQIENAFFIFAIRIGNETDNGDKAVGWKPLSLFSNITAPKERIFCIEDFETYELVFDWNNPKNIEKIVTDLTESINEHCPVSSFFGVDGAGEGIVWKPAEEKYLNNVRYWFKTKGDKHKQNKKQKDSSIDPIKAENIQQIIDEYLVENRLERGLVYFEEKGIKFHPKNTVYFINFIVEDLLKDAALEIKALNLTEKDIKKNVSAIAGKWFNIKFENKY